VPKRNFQATKPNENWRCDIIYVATGEGFLYLANIEDVISRKIIRRMMVKPQEASSVESALRMAMAQRHLAPGLLHYSDRSRHCTNAVSDSLLSEQGITNSMSSTGNYYGNGMQESFFTILKAECADYPFATCAHACSALFDLSAGWYNRQRLHSPMGCLSPKQLESQHALPFP
jgi:putative transposase